MFIILSFCISVSQRLKLLPSVGLWDLGVRDQTLPISAVHNLKVLSLLQFLLLGLCQSNPSIFFQTAKNLQPSAVISKSGCVKHPMN